MIEKRSTINFFEHFFAGRRRWQAAQTLPVWKAVRTAAGQELLPNR
jgi:hypothetical protein